MLGTADDQHTSYSPMEPLREQYAALGLHFSQGTLFDSGSFSVDGTSHFISSTTPVGTFDMPVYGISIQSRSYWDATLTAYDAQGVVLAAYTLKSEGDWKTGYLAVASRVAISSFSVRDTNPDHILNLDNLRLELSPAPVPEPTSLAMFAAGGLLLLAKSRRTRAM